MAIAPRLNVALRKRAHGMAIDKIAAIAVRLIQAGSKSWSAFTLAAARYDNGAMIAPKIDAKTVRP